MKTSFFEKANFQYRKNIKIAGILCAAFFVLLISVSFLILKNRLNKKIDEKEQQCFAEVNGNLLQKFHQVMQISSSYAISNTEFGANWNEKDIDAYSSLKFQTNLNLAMYNFIEGICIKNSNLDIVCGRNTNRSTENAVPIYNFGPSELYLSDENKLFMLSKYTQSNGEENTVSIFFSSYDLGKEVLSLYSENDKEFIVSNQGDIVISNRTEMIGKNLFGTFKIKEFPLINSSIKSSELSRNISVNQISDCPSLYLVRIYSPSIYSSEYSSLMLIFIILNAVALILFACSSILIAKYTYKPVRQLMELVSEYSSSSLENIDEITYIKESISNIYSDNSELKDTVNEQIKALQQQQLIALQTQISPHFLLNSLDAISWLSIDKYGEDNTVFESIQYIRSILKQCINITNVFSGISEELNLTKNCIALLQLKYNCKVACEINIPPELLNVQIMRFSLQPIIENSVKHGLSNSRDGKITIDISEKNKNLIVCVTDNGCGMDLETLTELRENMTDFTAHNKNHIGLKNINQRFNILYGDNYRFEITASDNGTQVTLEFPMFNI